jgi:hypothetical protein
MRLSLVADKLGVLFYATSLNVSTMGDRRVNMTLQFPCSFQDLVYTLGQKINTCALNVIKKSCAM